MKNVQYFTPNGVPLSLKNLFYRNDCSVVAIRDVVEDASTPEELRNGLNKLNLFEKFEFDRLTDTYVRLKSKDCFGNVHFLKAYY